MNSYYQVEPALLWYIITTGCCRQLAIACVMYNMAFDRKLDINSSYCDVYLYRTNTKDLNNVGDEISIFKLYGIMGYLSLYYLTTKEYELQQVKLEQEKV